MFYPKLYLFLTQFGDRQGILVNEETEITIEGFPRSANTFAVNAFRLAQNRSVNIAHHKHSISQIFMSYRLGIPLLVLIRKPEDAIISFIIREALISIPKAFKYWISFHNHIWQYRNSYILANFEEIVNNHGTIITKINDKF